MTIRSAMINNTPIASLVPTIVRILLPSSDHHPSYECNCVINLPLIPSLPNLVSQLLIISKASM
jgi:hypothetical protein